MTDRKQRTAAAEPPEAIKLPSRVEVPDLTIGDADEREEQAVTMLDYEGSPVVTYRVVAKRRKSSRDAS